MRSVGSQQRFRTPRFSATPWPSLHTPPSTEMGGQRTLGYAAPTMFDAWPVAALSLNPAKPPWWGAMDG
eukprot:976320-Alexandrium_andersonii.AAC.1